MATIRLKQLWSLVVVLRCVPFQLHTYFLLQTLLRFGGLGFCEPSLGPRFLDPNQLAGIQLPPGGRMRASLRSEVTTGARVQIGTEGSEGTQVNE